MFYYTRTIYYKYEHSILMTGQYLLANVQKSGLLCFLTTNENYDVGGVYVPPPTLAIVKTQCVT